MNIELKNTLDNLLLACSGAGISQSKQYIARDMYSFIAYISKANLEERFHYFSEVYLSGEKVDEKNIEQFENIPELFKKLCEYDTNSKKVMKLNMSDFESQRVGYQSQ